MERGEKLTLFQVTYCKGPGSHPEPGPFVLGCCDRTMKKASVGFTEAFSSPTEIQTAYFSISNLPPTWPGCKWQRYSRTFPAGIKQIAGRNTDILRFPWFEHDLGMQDGRCRLIHGGAELEPVLSRCIICHF